MLLQNQMEMTQTLTQVLWFEGSVVAGFDELYCHLCKLQTFDLLPSPINKDNRGLWRLPAKALKSKIPILAWCTSSAT